MRRLRIFLSSPVDVETERNRAEAVIRALDAELLDTRLEIVRWEDRHYTASSPPQQQIPRSSECELVLCIFWKRLGSELPREFWRPDGTPRTGTEYEFEDAVLSAREKDPPAPDILVYRKTAEITYRDETVDQERAEKRALDAFWGRWFRNDEGHFLALAKTFSDSDEFERQLKRDLRSWLESLRNQVDWDITTLGSPFRGLEVFDEQHAPVFLGRRRAVEIARARLMATVEDERKLPILLILGASGSGKSSLVRAGLVPRLLKPDSTSPYVARWRRLVVKPSELGTEPEIGLARRLWEAGALPELRLGDYQEPDALGRLFSQSPASAAVPLLAALDRIADAVRRREGHAERPRRKLA